MSLLIQMLGRNVPLHTWDSFVPATGIAYGGLKNPAKTAKLIFSQLSHDSVVKLVAAEFEALPAQVRLELRELCNNGNASGNVRKNVQRLDLLLQGKLLRDPNDTRFVNQRVETSDGVSYKKRKINEAQAAAQRKYAGR